MGGAHYKQGNVCTTARVRDGRYRLRGGEQVPVAGAGFEGCEAAGLVRNLRPIKRVVDFPQ